MADDGQHVPRCYAETHLAQYLMAALVAKAYCLEAQAAAESYNFV